MRTSNYEFRVANFECRIPDRLPSAHVGAIRNSKFEIQNSRSAFTITEMLVSLAVIMFIMAIVSEAFVAGLDSFRQLKSVGDLDQRLRAASILIRNDLVADHYNSPPDRISNKVQPAQGYFFINAPAAGVQTEAADGDGITSIRSLAPMLPVLAFTVNWTKGSDLKQDPHLMRMENYLAAHVAGTALATTTTPPLLLDPDVTPQQFADGNNLLTQMAEVGYFLTPTGASTPGGTPLFRLHRRQRLLCSPAGASKINAQSTGWNAADYPEISCKLEAGALHFHTLDDVSDPDERTLLPYTPPGPPPPPTPLTDGSDIILSDVLSFTIRVKVDGGNDFGNVPGDMYDSATATTLIDAVEIILRVWDVKTGTTRQVTIIQDL